MYDLIVTGKKSHYLGISLLVLLIPFVLLVPFVTASSPQAYQDYLFQADQYRKSTNEFQIAKTEYQKFKSLASETVALEKTKTMLTQRDLLLRSYLLLLNEKLNENTALNPSDKSLYQSLLAAEVAFLVNHSLLVPSVGTLADSVKISQELADRYETTQATIYRTVVSLALGELASAAKRYDQVSAAGQTLVNNSRQHFPAAKQITLDRWLLQIANKRTLYQQKADSLRSKLGMLEGDTNELSRGYSQLRQELAEARQYLVEGSSFIVELTNSLKYID